MAEVAALYARVSTTQQEQEATIESQVAALESYAQQQGYTLAPASYFLDNGVSGAKLVRPALERLRDQAAEGAFAVVLCLSPDRLARQCAHQWVLLDELQRAGVKVIFSNQAPVSDEPQGQLLLEIQGLFAEYERAMIAHAAARDLLIAYVPTANMGTALEMYVAHERGVPVVTISPLAENWVVRALSRRVYPNLEGFMRAVQFAGSLADLEDGVFGKSLDARPV